MHPDDLDVVKGIPTTSVARTLVDLAEVLPRWELVEVFETARAQGVLDIEAVEASAKRAGWRPSMPLLHEVLNQFRD